jgi:hypothetical protein
VPALELPPAELPAVEVVPPAVLVPAALVPPLPLGGASSLDEQANTSEPRRDAQVRDRRRVEKAVMGA